MPGCARGGIGIAIETTITAFCAVGYRIGKGWAPFEVDSTVWDRKFGEGDDSCRLRQNMPRAPVFTCTVRRPGIAELADDEA